MSNIIMLSGKCFALIFLFSCTCVFVFVLLSVMLTKHLQGMYLCDQPKEYSESSMYVSPVADSYIFEKCI